MFTTKDRDMKRTLALMMEEARCECNFDQHAAVRKVGEWIRQDRRFDNVGIDPVTLAKKAFECRQSGADLRLGPEPLTVEKNPMITPTWR